MKLRVLVSAISLSCALMLSVSAVHAATLTFAANLSGANENPAVMTPGTGNVTVVLDDVVKTLQISGMFSNLTSNTTAAHIHCCVPLGTNIVPSTVPVLPGFPLGVTNGTFSALLDLLTLASYNPPFVAANGGTAASAAMALIMGIETGQAYFNIHTTVNTGGEIRGQLAPVPLPAALPLFATGLGALGLLSWRRKRKTFARLT
jgi:hypothetical protein